MYRRIVLYHNISDCIVSPYHIISRHDTNIMWTSLKVPAISRFLNHVKLYHIMTDEGYRVVSYHENGPKILVLSLLRFLVASAMLVFAPLVRMRAAFIC